ncbi:extracellular solute-binding protein [Paenibacillus sp. 1011MAR3C5]|uniref:ABC transporter substrate-binding protein n=1 Tax=Paenibacillus sp. 1011MAR3C5 TaxID=1675787 RepID=UPI000E6C8D0D|nr:extracellular solute-binding protein [Paenibacillus sp. 1011MAR3C5]RJE88467.1 extracellular solute-binding protein [Paenibacillus sp. 1011MAR3C5]
MRNILIVFAILIALTACDQAVVAPEDAVDRLRATPIHMSKDPVELEFWSYYGGWEPIVEAFQIKHPNVKVHVKIFSNDTYVNAYQQAMADGKTPDVMIADSEHFGQFSAITGLENLLDYGAGQYEDDFSESLWNSNLSFDRSSLIGLPSGSSPMVTYYRADILEAHGFPSEPDELGLYMENPENWLSIARALKESNSYITAWPMDIIQIYDSSQPMFVDNMEFGRNTDATRKAIELAKTVYNEGLLSSTDIWTQFGSQAVKNGKSAMLYMGTWAANQIELWAPETAGLWRQTRLPFNLYGWVNSSSFMLPSSAANKQWAYTFIEYCVTEWSMKAIKSNSVPSYYPARGQAERLMSKSEFFGGQNLYALNETLAKQMEETVPTPIDVPAKAIWSKVINLGIERERNADAIIKEAEKEIRGTLGREINILKAYLAEQKKKEVALR